MMHDATSHWVKELNTVFMRAIADDRGVSKVPFSMKRVAGSFTGEVLCKEMITEISGIKALEDDAFNNIEAAILRQRNIATGLEKEYQRLHNDLKVCIRYTLVIGSERFLQVYLLNKTTGLSVIEDLLKCIMQCFLFSDLLKIASVKLQLEKLQSLQTEMENLMTKYNHLKNIDPTTIVDTPYTDSIIIPQPTPYFKISRLKRIERNKIILEIQPHIVPTCICGDGYSVNVKHSRLLEPKFGKKSSFSRYASHTSTGTIH